jgi:dephospho-CoA kinase
MKLPEIIGISGTNGAGKDTLAALRAQREKALHVTVSDILRDQLRSDGIPLERSNLIDLSTRWRQESGDYGILATKTIHRYLGEKALCGYSGLSVVSLRHPEEVRRVKEFGGMIVWVDADPKLRYERIKNSERGRIDDDKSFEEFIEEEIRELTPSKDTSSASVNLGAVRPLADEVVINNFQTLEEYTDYLVERYCIQDYEAKNDIL